MCLGSRSDCPSGKPEPPKTSALVRKELAFLRWKQTHNDYSTSTRKRNRCSTNTRTAVRRCRGGRENESPPAVTHAGHDLQQHGKDIALSVLRISPGGIVPTVPVPLGSGHHLLRQLLPLHGPGCNAFPAGSPGYGWRGDPGAGQLRRIQQSRGRTDLSRVPNPDNAEPLGTGSDVERLPLEQPLPAGMVGAAGAGRTVCGTRRAGAAVRHSPDGCKAILHTSCRICMRRFLLYR